MSSSREDKTYEINHYRFDKDAIELLAQDVWLKNYWPVVYILSSDSRKQAYVGESTSALNRLLMHLNHPQKQEMDHLHIITSPQFHKSATLDIESSLIRYFNGDDSQQKYQLLNGNLGLVLQNYYEKREYQALFADIWKDLQKEKIAIQDLKAIDNSDLFKYSPYKALSPDQYQSVLDLLDILNGSDTTGIVEGGAGTGKTVLAIFLMKLLVAPLEELFDFEADLDDGEPSIERKLIKQFKDLYPVPKIALVVPMTSLRNTLKTVFKSVKGLNSRMVIGPSEAVGKNYDILIVDEAHRLRQRKNITNYRSFDENNKDLSLGDGGTELDWILKSSRKQILFYDRGQSVKPSDVPEDRFIALKQLSKSVKLYSQLRIKGGIDYINYVDQL